MGQIVINLTLTDNTNALEGPYMAFTQAKKNAHIIARERFPSAVTTISTGHRAVAVNAWRIAASYELYVDRLSYVQLREHRE
jgi:hypothetical protein